MKPDPRIYRAALGVRAEESLYVDDCDVEAEGARALGLTAFHLSRNEPSDGRWRIQTLRQMGEYARRCP
ncbi:MAG: hypothetical protein Q4E13_00430 [Clostridia bacterium]|nr:hypothetical protein [Clostridia bacterium]